MKNPAGKPMPTALHGRSQFMEKNPSRNKAGRCLLSLGRYFASDPALRGALAQPPEASPQNHRMAEGRSFHLPSWGYHSGHNQDTVEGLWSWTLAIQALGSDVGESLYTFFVGIG